MTFYLSKKTGKIVNNLCLDRLVDILGQETLDGLVEDGTITEVKEPTVVDILRSGSFSSAVLRYREIHDCKDNKKAIEMVRRIEGDMKRIASQPEPEK